MENNPPLGQSEQSTAQPEAEVLVPRASESTAGNETTAPLPASSKDGKPVHKRAYRPTHRATFIGLAVVAAILLINAAVIGFIIRGQSQNTDAPSGNQVTVNQDALDKLGVNRDSVTDGNVILTVGPATKFKGNVTVGGDISVAGQFKLNSKFTANSGDFAILQAGDTTINKLNVLGDSSFSNASLRNDLTVVGTTRLQGPATLSQLLTINNSVNVSGNISVGSLLSANAISGNSITAVSTLTLGGHVVATGVAPAVVRGSNGAGTALGVNGSVSSSGSDQAGTIAFNVGVSSNGCGLIATLTFHTPYSTTPHVVVSPVGDMGPFYTSRSGTGFTVSLSCADGGTLTPGGYAFDYMVVQ